MTRKSGESCHEYGGSNPQKLIRQQKRWRDGNRNCNDRRSES